MSRIAVIDRALHPVRDGAPGTVRPRSVIPVVLIAAVFVGFLLSGCTSPQEPNNMPLAYQDLGDLDALRLDRGEKAAECLADAGYPGSLVQEDGSTEINTTDAQRDGYLEAAAKCMQEVCEKCGSPLSQATLTRVYELLLDTRTCLAREGIDVSEPPTLQVYLDSPELERWSPYREAAITVATSGRSYEISKACPDPESLVTYW